MKIKLLVLLTGTFLAVAYLIGCGGGGNNGSNTTCPVGQTYINGTCQVGYGANSYAQCAALQGTPQYQTCMSQTGCGGGAGIGVPYSGGYNGYSGYNGVNGVNGPAGYPNQNCGGAGYIGNQGYFPPQGGYIYQPMPMSPYMPPYYGYPPSGISWGFGMNMGH